MKEKRVYIFLFLISFFLLASIVNAQKTDEVEKAYSCLKNRLSNNCGNVQSTEQISFNLLAMSYDSKIKSDCSNLLKNNKKNNCWSEATSSSCSIKPTAIATLALKITNENVDDSINWLLEKRKTRTGLSWYLEIDTNNQSQCNINGRKVTILENKKISGQDPSGLVKSNNNYWFEITNLEKNYTISCDRDFVTTLLYKKPGSNVLYVSSETHFASAYESTTEQVNSYCFGLTDCDYEGSLWATLALAKSGYDISPYLPYLTAFSDDAINKKYFPSAFLYMLTELDDYYSDIVLQQQQNKYWDVSKRKLYDTSLAILSLKKTNAAEVDNAKDYLLSIQEASGCWSDNTALILYSAWPKEAVSQTPSQQQNINCENFGYYCTASTQCKLEDRLENFYCPGLSEICCRTQPREESCAEKNGIICKSDERCSEAEVRASDTNYCCLGSCQQIQQQISECEKAGYSCRSDCDTNEEEKATYSNSCGIGKKCCSPKPESKMNWLLIIILAILILLLILAIIFRNRLRLFLFKSKTKMSYERSTQPLIRPPISPLPPRTFLPPRPQPYTKTNIKKSLRDKDFEETMKKLREMSK